MRKCNLRFRTFAMSLIVLGTSLLFTGCGFNTTSYSNVDAVNTVVDLSNADYEIIETVTGESKQIYVFGIGGLSQKSLKENAKSDMYKNANLKSNEAIIYPSVTTSIVSYLGIVTNVRAIATGYKIRIHRGGIFSNKENLKEDIKNNNAMITSPVSNEVIGTEVLTFALNESEKYNMILLRTNNTEHDFYIGKTEVTKSLWNIVMAYDSTKMKSDDNKIAVNSISVEEIEVFLDRLNELLGSKLPDGYKFTIPTSSEWELAAKGGKKSNANLYSGGNDINEVAWYAINTVGKYYIATKKSNELNIYDMSGGVSEICKDGDSKYVTRGGSYLDGKNLCTIKSIQPFKQQYKSKKAGLRLVLTRDNNY